MAAEVIAGRYRLEQELGHGGMSEVWLATDTELSRPVALKLLAPNADRERFAREARAVAALSHPNIVQLFDFGETEGRPYMVFEYLPGGTLEDQLESGEPLPDERTEQVARDIAQGLAHAHANGLVHRDLKAANVLFDSEGRAKIADFGIARMGEGGTLTEAGTVLGTAAYISPEQAGGEPASPASDVYSFGVLLYRMLSGRLPFESDQPLELVALHAHAAPPPLEEVRPDVPPRLESLVAATLAKDPADRPPDGAALAAELRGAPTLADPTLVLRKAPRRRRRSRPSQRIPLAGLIGALLLLGAAGVGVAVIATRSGTPSPATQRTNTHSRKTTAPTTASVESESTGSTATTTTPATRPTPKPTTTGVPTVPTTVVTTTQPTVPTTAPTTTVATTIAAAP